MEKRKMSAEEILKVLEDAEYKEVVKALLMFESDYKEETFEDIYDDYLNSDLTKVTQLDMIVEEVHYEI